MKIGDKVYIFKLSTVKVYEVVIKKITDKLTITVEDDENLEILTYNVNEWYETRDEAYAGLYQSLENYRDYYYHNTSKQMSSLKSGPLQQIIPSKIINRRISKLAFEIFKNNNGAKYSDDINPYPKSYLMKEYPHHVKFKKFYEKNLKRKTCQLA